MPVQALALPPPPLQGQRLLNEAAGDGEDDGFGPEAPSDAAVAALPLPVRRRVAALKHNQVALYLVPWGTAHYLAPQCSVACCSASGMCTSMPPAYW